MANMLQSSQNKTTCAPGFYTNYLTNLACRGNRAQQDASFVGAQPLQQKAFETACQNAGSFQPIYQQGLSTLGCAANKNIAGAAQPYLNQALGTNTAQLAQCYMSPYINSAVNSMSDIANRNIQQNLSPMATAATVGSGQFGSQRGAQVLGQVTANALQCLNANVANMENQGYNQALSAATQRQQLLGQLGSIAGTTTAECARAKQAAGIGMGQLGTQASQQNLACINALAQLGAQCQTIKQNAQCYPFSTLAKYSSLLTGHQIPTSVKTTMCMSPLSAAGAIGAGTLGVLCKYPDIFCKAKKAIKCTFGKCIPSKLPKGMTQADIDAARNGWHKGANGKYLDACCNPVDCCASDCSSCCSSDCCTSCCTDCCSSCCACCSCCVCCSCLCCICGCASGGLVNAKKRPSLGMMGCGSLRMLGALPARRK
jgi:hypothetical protein